MSQFSEAWVNAQNAKRNTPEEPPTADKKRELAIHGEIIAHCKSMGWFFVHSRMDVPATNQVGTPDFIIATRTGTLWIEVKRKGSKPTTDQLAANYWLKTLGHQAHIVWSFDEFMQHARHHN